MLHMSLRGVPLCGTTKHLTPSLTTKAVNLIYSSTLIG